MGCQQCGYEAVAAKQVLETAEAPKLGTCPDCERVSLFWNERDGIHECLNPPCKAVYMPEELPSSS